MEIINELHEPHYSCDESEHDPVNHPKHYTSSDIECVDAMRAAFGVDQFKSFCQCAAFKYLWRSSLHKDGSDQNIKKAIWFLRMSIGDDPRKQK